jgi:hypothetical protein
MSSGGKPKPPATFEERNPFDISRRSGPEVAAEIAKRMAAWKQARARSYGTTAAAPGDAKAAAEAPPIAAPVQPARMPAPQTAPTAPRAPLFASFSAARRAVPAAAAVKQAAPLSQTSIEPARQSTAPDSAETATHGAREDQRRGTLEPSALPPQSTRDDALITPLEMQQRGSAASATVAEGNAGAVPAAAVSADAAGPPCAGERDRLDTPCARPLAAISIEALDQAAGRKEPTLDAPLGPQVAAIAVPAAARTAAAAQSGSVSAVDEMSGRQEPTFAANESSAPAAPSASAEPGLATAAISIDALYEVAGRKEPTFDKPAQRAAPALGGHDKRAAGRTRDGSAASAGRQDPRPDAPRVPTPVAAATSSARSHHDVDGQAAGRRIEPRAIETRIEARRIDALRADPQLAGRRPVLPRIKPEAWDVPPAVAARAERRRRSSAWAIGLGAALLIVGITAPAAIWQGRQGSSVNQDKVASIDPAPAQPVTATPPQDAPADSAPETQPAEQPQDAAVRPQVSEAAREPAPAAAPDTAAPERQAALSPVGDGGEVSEAPVVAPPPPALLESTTGQPAARVPVGPVNTSPMVARPFVPGPVMNPPTAGTASVAVYGTALPASRAATARPKPELIGQLKPKVVVKPASGGQQQMARKPRPFFQQSPEQMFNTLMDTLTNGRPINPANTPPSPSNRK